MKNIHILGAMALIVLAGPLAAGERSTERNEEPVRAARKKTADDTGSGSIAAAPSNAEMFRSVVIPAGKSVTLDSEIDFSSADKVAVTLRCTTCDSAANSMSSLTLQAFWSVANADSYAVVETKSGSTFPYWDSGGAVFQVFGSMFRLVIANKSDQGVIVQQVLESAA